MITPTFKHLSGASPIYSLPHKDTDLHVVVLPYSYPSRHCPIDGIFIQDQVQALHRFGLKVGVIYPEFRSIRTIHKGGLLANHFQTRIYEEQGIQTIRLHGWNLPKMRIGIKLWIQSTLRLLDLYIERWGMPHLLHAHNVLWSGVAANQAKRLRGIPFLITEHSTAYACGLIRERDHKLINEAFSEAFALVAVSRSLSKSISSYAPGKKIRVIPNVVDTEFFRLPRIERAEEPFRFLNVSILTARKAIDRLLCAFADAFRVQPQIVLEIGGDGPERYRLENLAVQLGIRDRVRFLGMLSRDQVREAMWRSNAFVLPSYVETFGVVLIEAMATGLFVIATRSGGPEEIVTPDVGILVETEKIAFLSKALKTAYETRHQFRPDDIRQFAVEHYGTENFGRCLSAVYLEAAKY